MVTFNNLMQHWSWKMNIYRKVHNISYIKLIAFAEKNFLVVAYHLYKIVLHYRQFGRRHLQIIYWIKCEAAKVLSLKYFGVHALYKVNKPLQKLFHSLLMQYKALRLKDDYI